MPLSDIVNVTITKATAAASKQSFGTLLIAAYHTHWSDRVRTYNASSALTTMVSEGFAVTDPAYRAMAAALSANPRVKKVKLGRRDTTWTHLVRITPVPHNTAVYSGKINDLPWTFTSDGSATLAEVCTGIAAAITALAGVSADGSSGTAVDVTADAAVTLFDVTYGAGDYSWEDVTPATGVVTDLTAINASDADFYVFGLDMTSSLAIVAAAGWAETQTKIFLYHTADSTVKDPSNNTNVMRALKALSYVRTAGIYTEKYTAFSEDAWAGVVLPFNPGEATWAFKVLSGITVSVLDATAQGAIENANGNYYVSVGDDNDTRWGVTAGGEYIDVTQSIDWMVATIGQRVYSWLRSAPKRSYEDASVSAMKNEIFACLALGQRRGVVAIDPAPTVDAPKVLDVDPSEREARHLPDVTFSFRLQGAIHTVDIAGTVSV